MQYIHILIVTPESPPNIPCVACLQTGQSMAEEVLGVAGEESRMKTLLKNPQILCFFVDDMLRC